MHQGIRRNKKKHQFSLVFADLQVEIFVNLSFKTWSRWFFYRRMGRNLFEVWGMLFDDRFVKWSQNVSDPPGNCGPFCVTEPQCTFPFNVHIGYRGLVRLSDAIAELRVCDSFNLVQLWTRWTVWMFHSINLKKRLRSCPPWWTENLPIIL